VRLILASRSPRRTALLEAMGLPFTVHPADVDETPHPDEAAAGYVVRLARTKAAAVWRAEAAPDRLVLGSDTAVVLDGRILGKPRDAEDAVAMLLALSGRTHHVLTGIAVAGGAGTVAECVTTEVGFRTIGRAEARAYWATGESADKAGAYGIQGIGGIFVTGIRGSYSAVVGLPISETERLLVSCGMDTWHERMHG